LTNSGRYEFPFEKTKWETSEQKKITEKGAEKNKRKRHTPGAVGRKIHREVEEKKEKKKNAWNKKGKGLNGFWGPLKNG